MNKNELPHPVAPSVGELEWNCVGTETWDWRSADVVGINWGIHKYRDGFHLFLGSHLSGLALAKVDSLAAAKSLANSLQRILSGAAEEEG